VGNYVTDKPLNLGNYMTADRQRPLPQSGRLERMPGGNV